MFELLKGSQPVSTQNQQGQGVVQGKVTNKYVENFERLLCAGAYKQLKERKDKGITEGIISKFSPNNVRRVVLGLDGIYVQFYVSPVNFKAKEQFVPITFTEQLGTELSAESKSTPITKVLRGDSRSLFGSRVFSSVEEIIILSSSPEVQGYLLDNHGLDWFLDPSRKQTVESSFKRLRAVGLVEDSVTCKEFVESHREQINDPYGLILRDTELNYVGALFNDDLYYTHTALRPQYYEMDEEGGALWNYFQEVKKGSPSRAKASTTDSKEIGKGFLKETDLTLVNNFLGLVHVLEGYQQDISADFPTLKETLEVGEHNKALAKEYVNSMVAFVKEHRDITSYPTPKVAITTDTTYLRAVSVANYLLKNKDKVGLSKGVDSVFVGYLTALTTCLELALEHITFDFMSSEFVSSYKSGLELYFSNLSDEREETEEPLETEEEVSEEPTEEDNIIEKYQGLYDKLDSFGFDLEGVDFKPLEREITLEGVDFLPESVLDTVGEVSPLFAVISWLSMNSVYSFDTFFNEKDFFQLACSLKDLDLSDEEALKLASFGIFGLESDSVFEGYNDFIDKNSKLKEQFGEFDSYFVNEGKGSEFKQIRPSFKEFAERFANEVSVELLTAPNYLAVDVLRSAYGFNAWGVPLPKVSQLPKLSKLLTDLVNTTRVSYRFRRDFEKFEKEFGADVISRLSSKHLTKEGDFLSCTIDPNTFVKVVSSIFSYYPPSEVRDISGVFQKALELVEKKEGDERE
jgi:hypothetical protein